MFYTNYKVSVTYLYFFLSQISIQYFLTHFVCRKSCVTITKEDLLVPEKSYERSKRLVETYLTHRQYVYFTKEAFKKAKSFVSR